MILLFGQPVLFALEIPQAETVDPSPQPAHIGDVTPTMGFTSTTTTAHSCWILGGRPCLLRRLLQNTIPRFFKLLVDY